MIAAGVAHFLPHSFSLTPSPSHYLSHSPPPPPTQGASTEDIQRRLHTLELLAAHNGSEGQRPINQLFQMPTIVTGRLSSGSQGGADPSAQPPAPSSEAAAATC